MEAFLARVGAGAAFDQLLGDLEDRLVPLLEVSPRLGAPFPVERLATRQGQALMRKIEALLGSDELRQLVRGEYLVLYLVTKAEVHLLGVKHGREQSYRLGR